jgi:hypothetical protein
MLAKGVIIRRRTILSVAERLDLDRRAIRRMPLLRVPGRSSAVILNLEHVHRVLEETPEPFAIDTKEKRAALAHFEPKGVLISEGAERADRRRYNEQVLESDRPAHASFRYQFP